MSLLNPTMDRVTDSAGRPINGGKLYPFTTGTTTAAAVYSDAALTTAHTHPVVASAAGLLPNIYLDPSITYDLKYTDADGAQVDFKTAISSGGYGSAPISAQAGASYVVVSGNRGATIKRTHSAAMTTTLPTAASVGNGFTVEIWDATTLYDNTISVSGGGTIDGSASRVQKPGQRLTFTSDGTEYTAAAANLSTGKRSFPYPAAAWKETFTSGCAAIARKVTATNAVNYDSLDFDGASAEFAYLITALPKSYKVGTLQFRVRWGTAVGSGTAAQTCIWGLAGRCYRDDDALDQAYGTLATVSDALLAPGDLQDTAWTSITPANDIADSLLALRLTRDAATDTLTVDGLMVHVDLRYELSASDDA